MPVANISTVTARLSHHREEAKMEHYSTSSATVVRHNTVALALVYCATVMRAIVRYCNDALSCLASYHHASALMADTHHGVLEL